MDDKELQKFKKSVIYNEEIHCGYYETPLDTRFLMELIAAYEQARAELAGLRTKDIPVMRSNYDDAVKRGDDLQAEVEQLRNL